MKIKLANLITAPRAIWTHVRSHRFFWLTIVIGLIAAIGLRFLWATYGDHDLVPPGHLDLVFGLILLNFGLAFVALPREPYASTLLLGATLTLEILVMIFLYQV